MCHIYQRTSTIMQFITMLQKLTPPFLFWRFFFIKWSNSKESNYCCTHGVYQYISNHLHNFRDIFFLFNYNFKENIVLKWYNHLIFNVYANFHKILQSFNLFLEYIFNLEYINTSIIFSQIILLNHLISIDKYDHLFFNLILWVLNYLIPSTICKKSFQY
jgi:hypothetical protein